MAQFFYYDRCEHKHQVFAFPIKNEKDEIVGYIPRVDRSLKNGGLCETVSDRHREFKYKVFSTEKLARDWASDFFSKLPFEIK